MKLRLLSARPAVTRLNRRDARGAQLESVAAEFALLAQRRARLARQLDLLSRQLDAATSSMNVVQARMGQLAQRMDQIDPGLRPAADIQNLVHAVNTMQNIRKIGGGVPPPPNPPSFPEARRGNAAPASPDTGGTLHPVFRRPMPPRRRPFLPE